MWQRYGALVANDGDSQADVSGRENLNIAAGERHGGGAAYGDGYRKRDGIAAITLPTDGSMAERSERGIFRLAKR